MYNYSTCAGASTCQLELGTKEKAFKFIRNLKLILNLTNIGDTKTIIIHPASTICAHNTNEEKEKMAVYDDLLRLSVGIEAAEDIISDIENALKAIWGGNNGK